MNSNTQTDTPETNAAIELCSDPNGAVELCDLCQNLERDRDKWKALAAQYSAEREHNAMQGLKYKAERDEARKKLQAELDLKELGFHMLRACLNLSGTHTWEELAGEVAACRKERDEARTALSGRTVSCSQCNETANGLEAARVKLEFLASKGITVGILKSSDCPQGHLAYVIKPDSELCDLKHIHRVIDAESKLKAMREAFDAAKAFIDSHVADPDITSEMVEKYAVYQDALAKLQPFLKP